MKKEGGGEEGGEGEGGGERNQTLAGSGRHHGYIQSKNIFYLCTILDQRAGHAASVVFCRELRRCTRLFVCFLCRLCLFIFLLFFLTVVREEKKRAHAQKAADGHTYYLALEQKLSFHHACLQMQPMNSKKSGS